MADEHCLKGAAKWQEGLEKEEQEQERQRQQQQQPVPPQRSDGGSVDRTSLSLNSSDIVAAMAYTELHSHTRAGTAGAGGRAGSAYSVAPTTSPGFKINCVPPIPPI